MSIVNLTPIKIFCVVNLKLKTNGISFIILHGSKSGVTSGFGLQGKDEVTWKTVAKNIGTESDGLLLFMITWHSAQHFW